MQIFEKKMKITTHNKVSFPVENKKVISVLYVQNGIENNRILFRHTE